MVSGELWYSINQEKKSKLGIFGLVSVEALFITPIKQEHCELKEIVTIISDIIFENTNSYIFGYNKAWFSFLDRLRRWFQLFFLSESLSWKMLSFQ